MFQLQGSQYEFTWIPYDETSMIKINISLFDEDLSMRGKRQIIMQQTIMK